MTIKVNGKIVKGDKVAYDGCHKIYILEDGDDMQEAKELEYSVYNIDKLEEIYKESCPLRFIRNWKCNIQYCPQFENAKIIIIKED